MKRRRSVRLVAAAAAVAASAVLLISPGSAQQSTASQNGAAQAGGSQTGTDDVILRAMRDELDRSRQLRNVGAGEDLPYFISYMVDDATSVHVSAALGAVVNVANNRYRLPTVEVRVGGYDFDNTGHIFSGFYSGSRYDSGTFPLDDSYATLRGDLWLATDRAYKTALESVARKRAALNSAAAPTEKIADFYAAEPVKSIVKVDPVKIDSAAWTARVGRLSGVFNAYPDVLSSGVELEVNEGSTYYLNSEGTQLRYADGVAMLFAKAEGQAPDGMIVHDGASFQALTGGGLASEADVRKGFTQVAEDVKALVHAPVGEEFSGPVLFEPQAAAQLFAQLLGDNLRAARKPLADPGRPVNFLPSEFETRFGGRILPEWMDVVDDPTKTTFQGKPLAGYYPFDIEGVAPKPVSVVEKGILKSYLTTRQPVKGATASNGHARFPGRYGTRTPAISNLFVTASQATPLADLKKQLIDLIKQRGKPYGMLVRKLDFPFSAGGGDLQALAQGGSQSGGSARPVSPPILLYKVYPDGREELVRGLRFRGVSSRSLRDILAASQETALFDYVNDAAPLALLGAGGYLAPTSVAAPGLLFDELEFEPFGDQLQKPPIVPPPTAAQ